MLQLWVTITSYYRRCSHLTRTRVTETSGAWMGGQSTNMGCVSNVMSTEVSSNNHAQLAESEKETGHHESSVVDIGEDIKLIRYS